MSLSEFTGKDLSEFAESFGPFLRMTGQTHASGRVKCDLLMQCCKTKYPEKQGKQIVTKSATLAEVLAALERQYPSNETDHSIRTKIQNLAALPNNPKSGPVFTFARRLGPLGRACDACFLWQQRPAILVRG